jgi:hypothetical protein
MADIRDDHVYTLEHERGSDAPTRWIYANPTADDILQARRAGARAAKAADGGETFDGEEFGLSLLARCLRGVEGLTAGGKALPYPGHAAPIDDRRAFVGRLPYRWAAELSVAVQEDSDLDEEEERDASTPGSGDLQRPGEAVRLRDVSGGASA